MPPSRTRELAALRLAPVRTWSVPLVIEAAVAVILRGTTTADAEVLLVRRATKHGDPWSGDMAFPGGRRGVNDHDGVDTAMRETREEVGAKLARAWCIGGLTPLVTLAPSRRSRVTPMVVTPVVFVARAPLTLTPNHEIADARWVPLARFAARAEPTTRRWRVLGIQLNAPAWRLDDDVVWGLTHVMLKRLLRIL